MPRAAQIHHTLGKRRRGHEGFIDDVGCQQLEDLTGFEHEYQAVFPSTVDSTIRCNRGSAETMGAVRNALIKMFRTGLQIVAAKEAVVV